MSRSPKERDRSVISFLKDESHLIYIIFSSLLILGLMFLTGNEEAAMIAAFISAAASCFALSSMIAAMILYADARRSIRNPVIATLWCTANSIALYFAAGSHKLTITLVMGSALSIVAIGLGYFLDRRSTGN